MPHGACRTSNTDGVNGDLSSQKKQDCLVKARHELYSFEIERELASGRLLEQKRPESLHSGMRAWISAGFSVFWLTKIETVPACVYARLWRVRARVRALDRGPMSRGVPHSAFQIVESLNPIGSLCAHAFLSFLSV